MRNEDDVDYTPLRGGWIKKPERWATDAELANEPDFREALRELNQNVGLFWNPQENPSLHRDPEEIEEFLQFLVDRGYQYYELSPGQQRLLQTVRRVHFEFQRECDEICAAYDYEQALLKQYRELRLQMPDDDDALRVVMRQRFPAVSDAEIQEVERLLLREIEKVHMDRVVALYREIHDANPGASKTEVKNLFAQAIVNDSDLTESYLRDLPHVRGAADEREEEGLNDDIVVVQPPQRGCFI